MPWLTHRDSLNAATASISAKLKEGVKVTIQNDLQNTTSQHGGRRRLDNAVVDMMIKHITDQVQDQLAEYQNVLDNKSYEAKEVVDDTKNKVEKFLRDEWEELENVLTAGDDAQSTLMKKCLPARMPSTGMQATKEKVIC